MNVVIIGAGPAGEAAAKALRRLKNSAAAPEKLGVPPENDLMISLIEKEEAGGLCLNKGCIPSKTLLEHVHHQSRAKLPIQWPELQKFKTGVVQKIRGQLETSLKNQKIDLIRGTAQFIDASSLLVRTSSGPRTIRFDKAIVATGTESYFPPPFDRYRAEVLDSDKMLEISETPRSLIVIGGGAVGCEFACLLNAAGCETTLLELTNGLLPSEDEAVVTALTQSFEARGIRVKTGVTVESVTKSGSRWTLKTSSGESISADQLLISAGRMASLKTLALDKAGIKFDRVISVNKELQTSNPNVYAAGDVAGTRLAHAAATQAEIAAANILGGHLTFDDRFVPRCLYSWPEVASVGAWKYQLEKEGRTVKTVRAFFQGSAKALAADEAEGFVQIVVDPINDRILGAQIIGPHATELIHVFSVALKKEMRAKELAEVMFAHPTLSEVIKEAAKK